MDRTVQMESASCSERPNGFCIIAVKRQVRCWRAIFLAGLGRCAIPAPVFDDMGHCHIINKRQAVAFLKSNTLLDKVGVTQMHCRIAATTATTTAAASVVTATSG